MLFPAFSLQSVWPWASGRRGSGSPRDRGMHSPSTFHSYFTYTTLAPFPNHLSLGLPHPRLSLRSSRKTIGSPSHWNRTARRITMYRQLPMLGLRSRSARPTTPWSSSRAVPVTSRNVTKAVTPNPTHYVARSFHTRSRLSLQASGLPKAAEAASTSASASSSTTSYSDGGPATPGVTTDAKSRSVYITWASGITSKFHSIWLRDHCRCSQCYHPTTKQRLLNTFEIAPDAQPISAEATTEGLLVHWPLLPSERAATASSSSSSSAPASDASQDAAGAGVAAQHPSLYPWRWLMRNSYSPVLSDPITASSDDSGLKAIEKVLWGKRIGSAPPTVKYDEVMQSEEGVLKWVTKIVSVCRPKRTVLHRDIILTSEFRVY